MNIFKKAEDVELIEVIEKEKVPWKYDSGIVYVRNGMGKMFKQIIHHSNIAQLTLFLEDKPLVSLQADEYYCPTCAKLIEAGYGLQAINSQYVESIKSGESSKSIQESINLIKPLLKMLPNGLYAVSKIKMYPTDGEGNFFWSQRGTNRHYGASADFFYSNYFCDATPKYLYASQPLSRLNYECVEMYRNQIQAGETLDGLAYYLDGFLSLLLDGHHRATAACLENKELEILTIMDVRSFKYNDNRVSLMFGNETFEISAMKNRQKIEKVLKKPFKSESKTYDLNGVANDPIVNLPKDFVMELERMAMKYPDYMLSSLETKVKDISVNRILELWDFTDEESSFEIEILIKSLYIRVPDELLKVLIKMVRHNRFSEHKELIYRYLSYYDSKEVEDLFIEYLLDNMHDKHDLIRIIADQYLANRS